MDNRESQRLTFQGQPIILERDNWAQFKDAVKILCLKMGDAGRALFTGKEQMSERISRSPTRKKLLKKQRIKREAQRERRQNKITRSEAQSRSIHED